MISLLAMGEKKVLPLMEGYGKKRVVTGSYSVCVVRNWRSLGVMVALTVGHLVGHATGHDVCGSPAHQAYRVVLQVDPQSM